MCVCVCRVSRREARRDCRRSQMRVTQRGADSGRVARGDILTVGIKDFEWRRLPIEGRSDGMLVI